MVLSNLRIKDLSRALSVSKQWNGTILGSAELRRTLFLESELTEYLHFVRGTDQRCYEVPRSVQPVITRGPLVERDNKAFVRAIVEPHPVFLGRFRGSNTTTDSNIDINLPNYVMLTSVPASALLFQPPLDQITIDYSSRPTQIKVPGGVTFGAALQVIEKAQVTAKEAMVRSPRFGGYLLRIADRLTVTIRANGAILHDADYVQSARRALVKAKEFAILDGLEGKSTEGSRDASDCPEV